MHVDDLVKVVLGDDGYDGVLLGAYGEERRLAADHAQIAAELVGQAEEDGRLVAAELLLRRVEQALEHEYEAAVEVALLAQHGLLGHAEQLDAIVQHVRVGQVQELGERSFRVRQLLHQIVMGGEAVAKLAARRLAARRRLHRIVAARLHAASSSASSDASNTAR